MPKRTDYLSWDEYFMGIALLSKERSKDPSTTIGACIVDENNRIVSIGYNGMPNGISDDDIPWEREGGFADTKYAYVCHAELNAIMNAKGKDLKNCRVYVTLFPCNECAKIIVQSGIKEIIYAKDTFKKGGNIDSDSVKVSKIICDKAKVKYLQYNPTNKKITLDL